MTSRFSNLGDISVLYSFLANLSKSGFHIWKFSSLFWDIRPRFRSEVSQFVYPTISQFMETKSTAETIQKMVETTTLTQSYKVLQEELPNIRQVFACPVTIAMFHEFCIREQYGHLLPHTLAHMKTCYSWKKL
jgi:hypothetical protein